MPWGPQEELEIKQEGITSCMLCNDFKHEGQLAEGRVLHEEHRREVHGITEVPKLKRAKRRSPWKSQKTLEENIVGARQQGAASWVGDEE